MEQIEDKKEEKEIYIQKITEMLENVKYVGTLEYLHTFIKLFLEKWG